MALDSIVLVLVRWIHFAAAFTVIGAIFTSVIVLTPVIKTLQPEVRGSITVKLLPRMIRVQIAAALILMVAGVALAAALGGSDYRVFLNTKWGLSILTGGILTLVMFFNALLIARPTIKRLVKALSHAGEKPSSATTGPPAEVVKLQNTLNRVIPTNFVLALIILFLMGFAAHG